ncbi:MAG: hypothetical protein RL095_456 [Verrucomicrobiota bacterium]|jgi:hypothetical protein
MDKLSSQQMILSFGPGAMVDLPDSSVLISGLDSWRYPKDNLPIIKEERLLATLKAVLKRPDLDHMRAPPRFDDSRSPAGQASVGSAVHARRFPNWFVVQNEVPHKNARRRRLVHFNDLQGGEFRDPSDDKKRKFPVVPVRFVRACPKGHIGDIDWVALVHQEKCSSFPELWLEERGTSGEMDQITILCANCKQHREMARLVRGDAKVLGFCDGARPWLGPHAREECHQPSRLLVRSATNTYFPAHLSVISIPDARGPADEAVAALWEDFLSDVESEAELAKVRKKPSVANRLSGLEDGEVFQAIERKRSGGEDYGNVKELEFEAFTQSRPGLGEDAPDGDFYARLLPKKDWEAPWTRSLEKVVLVHRLREVNALVGFTRLEAPSQDVKGGLEVDVQRAEISTEARWLPAIENRGEGIFLQFKAADIESWKERSQVYQRGSLLAGAYVKALAARGGKGPEFPGLPVYLLHSLSHILMTQLSLDCGYPASSLKERLYCLPGGRYGILIFTASGDAQGTLGGLVEAGRDIRRHLRAALDTARLCSNDPVCSHHHPQAEHGPMHGAACHGCLLIAETSCELRNLYLDRCLLVPTLGASGVAFFTGDL